MKSPPPLRGARHQPDALDAALVIDVPDVADADLNRIPDLLEVSQATAPVMTAGAIVHDEGIEGVDRTLAADPEDVELPLPAEGTRLYRVRVL
jgi:hypothetical protein